MQDVIAQGVDDAEDMPGTSGQTRKKSKQHKRKESLRKDKLFNPY